VLFQSCLLVNFLAFFCNLIFAENWSKEEITRTDGR
jgi:hypothetical protein